MLYNPTTGMFTATANSMTTARAFFTATFLDPAVVSAHGGEILIAGGYNGGLPTGGTALPSYSIQPPTSSLRSRRQ